MRSCSIEHCENKHEAKGFCKKHYKSFSKYGDALFVEKRKILQGQNREMRVKIEEETRLRKEKLSVCMLKGCGEKVYARFLCNKHYASFQRTGEIPTLKSRHVINTDTCLAIECSNPHYKDGFCKSHLTLFNQGKSPYRPKILKLCGVEECFELHHSIGLCKKHYVDWRTIRKKYRLDD